MGSRRPRLPGFGDDGGGRGGQGRGGRGRGGFYPQQYQQGGRGAAGSYHYNGQGAAPQPRGATMVPTQQWRPAGPAAAEDSGHGQPYREVHPQQHNNGGPPATITPELHQAMVDDAPHEPADMISSPEAAGSLETSPPQALEVVTEHLEVLSMQSELSASQGIVQAIQLSSSSYKFPHRPGRGSIGTRCLVKANHFLAELPDKDLHQYDVRVVFPSLTANFSCTYYHIWLTSESC